MIYVLDITNGINYNMNCDFKKKIDIHVGYTNNQHVGK